MNSVSIPHYSYGFLLIPIDSVLLVADLGEKGWEEGIDLATAKKNQHNERYY